MLAAVVGASIVISGLLALQSTVTSAPVSEQIASVEHLSAPAAELGAAFDRLCQETGCDADAIMRTIRAGATVMSVEELRAALATQTALLARMAERKAATGAEDSGLLILSMRAEQRIADMYHAALAARSGVE